MLEEQKTRRRAMRLAEKIRRFNPVMKEFLQRNSGVMSAIQNMALDYLVAEREACAKVVDAIVDKHREAGLDPAEYAAKECAAAIRSWFSGSPSSSNQKKNGEGA